MAPMTESQGSLDAVTRRLSRAGCLAADDEAKILVAAAQSPENLAAMIARREDGEPLPWIVGSMEFGPVRLTIHSGVFVPRPHTVELAKKAVTYLPKNGLAVDMCTGSGAIAAVMGKRRPQAQIWATDIDAKACECARANGVTTVQGSFGEGLPPFIRGHCDVVTAVVPYVPTDELPFLPRDVQVHEPRHALDGGKGGTVSLVAAIKVAKALLHPGGHLLLEVGGDQDVALQEPLKASGFDVVSILRDEDGDLRGIDAVLSR